MCFAHAPYFCQVLQWLYIPSPSVSSGNILNLPKNLSWVSLAQSLDEEKCREIILDAAADLRDASAGLQTRTCAILSALAHVDPKKSESGIIQYMFFWGWITWQLDGKSNLLYIDRILYIYIKTTLLYISPFLHFSIWGSWGARDFQIPWLYVPCGDDRGRDSSIRRISMGQAVRLYQNHVQNERPAPLLRGSQLERSYTYSSYVLGTISFNSPKTSAVEPSRQGGERHYKMYSPLPAWWRGDQFQERRNPIFISSRSNRIRNQQAGSRTGRQIEVYERWNSLESLENWTSNPSYDLQLSQGLCGWVCHAKNISHMPCKKHCVK